MYKICLILWTYDLTPMYDITLLTYPSCSSGSDGGGSVITQDLESDLDLILELTCFVLSDELPNNLAVPHFLICKLKTKIIAFIGLL